MRLNNEGKIIAYDKAIGKKSAIKKTLDTMELHCDNGKDYSGKCFICHSNNLSFSYTISSVSKYMATAEK